MHIGAAATVRPPPTHYKPFTYPSGAATFDLSSDHNLFSHFLHAPGASVSPSVKIVYKKVAAIGVARGKTSVEDDIRAPWSGEVQRTDGRTLIWHQQGFSHKLCEITRPRYGTDRCQVVFTLFVESKFCFVLTAWHLINKSSTRKNGVIFKCQYRHVL